MALTLSTIREAIGAQLRANLDREINVDVDGAGMPAPVIRLVLDAPPDYFGTFGPDGVAFCEFLLEIDPAGNDQSAVRRLDDFLSVGAGNGSSVIDALKKDQTFGGVVSGMKYQPDRYDADNVTASYRLTFVAMKQGAEV